MTPFDLIRLLAGGEVRSAEGLGLALGCSPASVRSQIRGVEALGLRVLKLHDRGYRLAQPLDLIDATQLEARLSRLQCRYRVEVLDQCASTNSLLLARTLRGAAHASVIACEHQTSGRGRRGAEWLSAVGGSLSFSILWRFQQGASGLSGLSLAVSVAVARALESMGIGALGLKWPNDVLFGGRKLGGILIEMSGDSLGPSAAVIGIGLNVRLPEELRRRLPQAVADLSEHGPPPPRTLLLARLLEEIAAVLEDFTRQGFVHFRDEWLARHAWQGRKVVLKVSDRLVADGEAIGIGEDGALLLRSGQDVQRFHAGELALKAA